MSTGTNSMQSGASRNWPGLDTQAEAAEEPIEQIRNTQRVVWYVLAIIASVELVIAGWLVGALLHH